MSLAVIPSRLMPGQTRTIHFADPAAAWLTTPPTYSPIGMIGIVTVGPVTVNDNTHSEVDVTYPAGVDGTIEWSDSTTGRRAEQRVEASPAYGLAVSPTRIVPNQTATLLLTGTGTAWLTTPPAVSVLGITGVVPGAVTVISDTYATVSLTYGPATGYLELSDDSLSPAPRAVQFVGGAYRFPQRRRTA